MVDSLGAVSQRTLYLKQSTLLPSVFSNGLQSDLTFNIGNSRSVGLIFITERMCLAGKFVHVF